MLPQLPDESGGAGMMWVFSDHVGAPACIVHGGAGYWDMTDRPGAIEGVTRAADQGLNVLLGGGTALDAAQMIVEALERDQLFNAGIGSVLTAEGTVECDAAIMDGTSAKVGAVTGLRYMANPIRVARALADVGPHAFLAGEGALRFAVSHGFQRVPEERLVTPHQRELWERWKAGLEAPSGTMTPPARGMSMSAGTVGAVCVDGNGAVASATSTGGVRGKSPGRVGDSCVIGAGTWADEMGAVSCTGPGEAMIRQGTGRGWLEGIRRGFTPDNAAERLLRLMALQMKSRAGLVGVLAGGTGVVGYSTEWMPWAIRSVVSSMQSDA